MVSLRSAVAVLAILCGALVTTGCKKTPQSEPTPDADKAGTDSQPSVPAVELSDLKITLLSAQSYRASVKYRFTQGGPNPEAWYMVGVYYSYGDGNNATVGVVSLAQAQGKELKAEGVLQQEFGMSKQLRPGGQFKYAVKVEQGVTQSYHDKTVSNILEDSVTYQP
jgi:hypothetical protein